MELNEKLATWAGFTWREFELTFGGPPRPSTGWYIYRKMPSVEELSEFFLISLLHTGFSKAECDILAKETHAMFMEDKYEA